MLERILVDVVVHFVQTQTGLHAGGSLQPSARLEQHPLFNCTIYAENPDNLLIEINTLPVINRALGIAVSSIRFIIEVSICRQLALSMLIC